jgi:hypothetical protein
VVQRIRASLRHYLIKVDLSYFPLEGALPRLPPEGFPVVLGQLPPGPGWLEGPRLPLLFELELDMFISFVKLTTIGGDQKIRLSDY